MDTHLNILQDCKLFSGIADSDISSILSCLNARTKTFPKGDFVLTAGSPARHVGIVLEGAVQIIQEDYWGTRTLIDHIDPSGIFAEAFACVEDAVLPLSVIAAKDSTIMFLDYKRIVTVCSSSCEFHVSLIKNMVSSIARKNINLTRKMEITSKRTLREKVLAYLSMQAIITGSSTFAIPFSRQEFADYLAVDRASLSRALSGMQDEGLIRYSGRSFTLCTKSKA